MTTNTGTPLSLEDFKAYRDKGFMVIDTRSPQEFAEGFIPEAVNVAFETDFDDYVKTLLLSDRGVILVSHEGNPEIEALKTLGFTNVAGFLEGGMDTWLQAGEPLDMVISIGPNEFSLDYRHDEEISVYDLRPEIGFQQEHLKDTVNTTTTELLNQLSDFPNNKTYYVMCYDGILSMGVIALIKARGHHNFYHVAGGYKSVRDEDKVELIRAKGQQQKDQNGNSQN